LGFRLEEIDRRGETGGEDGPRLWVRSQLSIPFDMSSGPLLRVQLIRLEEKTHLFLLLQHHIISDALSMEVFYNELFLLYDGFARGNRHPLPPLRVQYKDFAAYRNRQLAQGHILGPHRDYWLRQMGGPLPPLELPGQKQRSRHPAYEGDTAVIYIDADLTRGLKALGGQYGASLYMVLLAAIKVLFYRYTGLTDIILGTTVNGRDHADLEKQIGFYIDTLPLRTRFDPGDSFEKMLEKVKGVTLAAQEHKAFQFDMLVEELGIRRDTGRHPLFDIVVDMINYSGTNPAPAVPSLEIAPFDPGFRESKFDLTVYIYEGKDSLDIRFEYKTGLFDAETMVRMARRLETLLSGIVENPMETVSRLPVDKSPGYPPIKHTAVEEAPIPASYHQERLWFIDRFETGNLYESTPVYHNIPLLLKIRGPLQREKLGQSIREVIQRHPALRTRVITMDDKPFQWIHREKKITLSSGVPMLLWVHL